MQGLRHKKEKKKVKTVGRKVVSREANCVANFWTVLLHFVK